MIIVKTTKNMKKRFLLVAASLTATVSFSQMQNKNGLEILPEAGDYAIQVDATPLLNFGLNAVNIMNNTGDDANGVFLNPNGTSVNTTIRGKYFTSATEAYRVNVGINTGSMKYSRTMPSLVDPDDADLTVDSTVKYSEIILGGGMEWRRGHNRLQGFYGGELNISIGSQAPLSQVEIDKSLEDAVTDYGFAPAYVTKQKGSAFGLMINGFAGVEYFVLPKISIGGQVSWGLNIQSKTKVTTTVESFNGTDTETTEVETTPGPSNFGFAGNYSANLFATFHF